MNKIKYILKHGLPILIIMLLIINILFIFTSSLNVSATMPSDNFTWGVNAHNYNYGSYPINLLENQIAKAAELGVKMYRINTTPDYTNGNYAFNYLDEVVNLCKKYGLKVYLVIFDHNFSDAGALKNTEKWYFERCRDIASRYKSSIDYIQISNEQDVLTAGSNIGTGSSTAEFNTAKFDRAMQCMRGMLNGIKIGGANIKRVINISYKHTGFLQKLQDCGLTWEVNALDWYSNMGDPTSTLNVLNSMPQKEIIIAESNRWHGTMDGNEQAQSDYLLDIMSYYSNSTISKIKGYIIYELFDEPQFGELNGESYFGLISCDSSGLNWKEKQAFWDVRKTLIGKAKPTNPITDKTTFDEQNPPPISSDNSKPDEISSSNPVSSVDHDDKINNSSNTTNSLQSDSTKNESTQSINSDSTIVLNSKNNDANINDDNQIKSPQNNNKLLIILLIILIAVIILGAEAFAVWKMFKKIKNNKK